MQFMVNLDMARGEMIEAFGRTAQSFGLNRLFGQIYILLYLSEDALSLDALTTELGVSKASVSIACRQLEFWGAVRRTWIKGDRRGYYMAETDFTRILVGGVFPSVAKKLDSAKVQIERSLKMLKEQGPDGDKAEFLRKRLEEADRYRAWVVRFINNPLVRKFV
jgi:DNA-binding transcriptional regulator GbsR (MarR family)